MNRQERRARKALGKRHERKALPYKKALEAHDKKIRLTVIATSAHLEIDQIIDEERKSQTPTLTCTKGCAACCKQTVLTSRAEAFKIARYHPDVVEDVLEKLVYAEAEHDNLPSNRQGPLDPFKDHERLEKISEEWWRKQIDCPFLADDKTCRVYESRPFMCRTMFVVSPAAQCEEPEPGAVVHGWRPPRFAYAQLGLYAGEAELMKDVLLGPLPTLVLYARNALKETL